MPRRLCEPLSSRTADIIGDCGVDSQLCDQQAIREEATDALVACRRQRVATDPMRRIEWPVSKTISTLVLRARSCERFRDSACRVIPRFWALSFQCSCACVCCEMLVLEKTWKTDNAYVRIA